MSRFRIATCLILLGVITTHVAAEDGYYLV